MKNRLDRVILQLQKIQMDHIEDDLYVLVNADINAIEVYNSKTSELIKRVKASCD